MEELPPYTVVALPGPIPSACGSEGPTQTRHPNSLGGAEDRGVTKVDSADPLNDSLGFHVFRFRAARPNGEGEATGRNVGMATGKW